MKIIILVTLLSSFVANSQTVSFFFTTGANSSYNLSDIQNITYSGDTMNLKFNFGNTVSWNVNTIDYFQYNENPLELIEKVNNSNSVLIYPNPTEDNINVNYTVGVSSHVQFDVLDIKGNLVKNLIDENKIAGNYKISFNILELSSDSFLIGTYLYRLIIGNQVFSHKVIHTGQSK